MSTAMTTRELKPELQASIRKVLVDIVRGISMATGLPTIDAVHVLRGHLNKVEAEVLSEGRKHGS